MNMTIAGALFRDAFYQILDNKVFRLLVLATLIPIALSFWIGFTETELEFFWGYESMDYNEFLKIFGIPAMEGAALRERAIQAMQSALIELLAGNIGISFCIAATAFFVPRMLERGTADTLFSKPVSRATLLFARYFSGVLFVFLLSSVLVLGVHLGFTLVSGYSDPGFLWGILTLTYIYAIVQAFSIAVAAVTRSSVAAILCTLMLYWFTGCVHTRWYQMKHVEEMQQTSEEFDIEAPEGFGKSSDRSNSPTWVKVLVTTFDGLHYTLPKTTDADVLTKLLRRSIEGDPTLVEDMTGGLLVDHAPDFGDGIPIKETRDYQDDSESFVITWQKEDPSTTPLARIQLSRSYRKHATLHDGSRGERLSKPLRARILAKARVKELSNQDGVTDVESETGRIAQTFAVHVRWVDSRAVDLTRFQETLFGYGDYNYMIESRWDPGSIDEAIGAAALTKFENGMSFPKLAQTLGTSNKQWLQKKMSLTAPLTYNIFFSIGSSFAFAFLMLFLGWLKLRRINF